MGDTDAVLVVDGKVVATGEHAIAHGADAQRIDLNGGFPDAVVRRWARPSAVRRTGIGGSAIRSCTSVDDIVLAVKEFAAENPNDDWILGALRWQPRPGGLFDARWLDAAVPDRPVALRAWDYHTMWVNTVALQRAGITPRRPTPF